MATKSRLLEPVYIAVLVSWKINEDPLILDDVSSNASDTNGSVNAVYSTLRPLDISSLGYISCLP